MSFLLDALRKSEGRERVGRVPTIHDTEWAGSDERRARPLVWWLAGAMAVLAAFFGWRYFNVDGKEPLEEAAQPIAVADRQAAPRAGGNGGAPAAMPKLTVASPGAPLNTERTPVESFAGGHDAAAVTSPAPEAVQPATGERSGVPAEDAGTAAEEGGQAASRQAGQAASGTDYRTPTMSEISYWSLPGSVREEIPTPRITVLVYAENPGDRFVLMNGRRLQEGDEAAPGMVVEEIRREGVVFSYRLYRFAVSR